jgi:hypothetical protein
MKTRLVLVMPILVMTAWVVALCVSPSRITYESYEKIKLGMTRTQVEEILGGPPRQEVKLKWRADCLMHGTRSSGLALAKWPEEWCGSESKITVYFNGQGVVVWAFFSEHPGDMEVETFWDRARTWSPW